MSIREFVHYSLKCFHLGIVSHLKILPLKANVDFPRVFLSSFFFLTYTLVTLSLQLSPNCDSSQGLIPKLSLLINQSWHQAKSNKLPLRLPRTAPVRLWQARLVWRVWPGTDHRHTKGLLLGDLKRSEVPFWKQQKINGVGGLGPEGSMLYLNKKVKFKRSPTGGDIDWLAEL